MFKVREKRIIRNVLFGRVGIIIFFFMILVLVKGTWSVYQKSQFARESRDVATNELKELTTREESLKSETQRLNTPIGVEEELRHSFDVGQNGEKLIVLVDSKNSKEVVPKVTQHSIWYKILHILSARSAKY